MVKITTLIIKLLHTVDADETPSLDYVYEDMAMIHKGIMTTLGNKKNCTLCILKSLTIDGKNILNVISMLQSTF